MISIYLHLALLYVTYTKPCGMFIMLLCSVAACTLTVGTAGWTNRKLGTVGSTLPLMNIKFLDADGVDVPNGDEGEVSFLPLYLPLY